MIILKCLGLAVLTGLCLGVTIGLVSVVVGWILRKLWPEEDE